MERRIDGAIEKGETASINIYAVNIYFFLKGLAAATCMMRLQWLKRFGTFFSHYIEQVHGFKCGRTSVKSANHARQPI